MLTWYYSALCTNATFLCVAFASCPNGPWGEQDGASLSGAGWMHRRKFRRCNHIVYGKKYKDKWDHFLIFIVSVFFSKLLGLAGVLPESDGRHRRSGLVAMSQGAGSAAISPGELVETASSVLRELQTKAFNISGIDLRCHSWELPSKSWQLWIF